MAAAAVRTFSKVKSSAMTPRQPSVPNLMGLASLMALAADSSAFALYQVDTLDRRQALDHLPYILATVAGSHQDGVLGLNHHDVVDAHEGDKLLWTVRVVAVRIDGQAARGFHDIFVGVGREALGDLVFVERGPRAEVVP